MITTIKILCVIAGVMFPMFLIKAIKSQDDEKTTQYTSLASICFGFITFALMGFL